MATGKEGPGTVHRAVLPAVMLSLATVVSAVASLNTAVPSIARDTHAGLTELAWIIDAYALVFAALLLLGGAIGDRYGRRRALAAGLVVFGAGSAAAALASDPDWLIAMRGVLGVGAALVMPATLSTITSTFPAEQRTRAVGAWAGVAGASGIFGLLVSGSLLEAWSWRSVFWMNVVLAVVALVATLAVVPESAEPDAPRLDLTGAVITVAGLGAGVYSIIEAPVEGWGSPRTLLGLGAAVVILAGFVLWELRRPNPLLDPRLFRIRAFSAGALTITLQFFAFFGFVFIVLQYLQLVKGDSALVGALSLLPMALMMMPFARGVAPRLAARLGPRRVVTAGLLLVALAMLIFSLLDEDSTYWLLLAGLVPFGAGMGLAMTPSTASITDALPVEKQGVGSAMNDLARELGGALGIAVLGSILQSAYRANLNVDSLPGPVAEQAESSLAVAMRIGPQVADQARAAFGDGVQSAFLTASVALAVTAVIVAVLYRAPRREAAAPAAGAEGRSAALQAGGRPAAPSGNSR
ncbi:MFS transporter [Actinomadura madurae]|uniref:Drug resistance transporter, EmrB/QacA subfamily n=1 Tax=Actinomadura madurae TaxID=1993 RepID=A0A1I5QA16_9ACTN|nr:MFS transporter [Actinomadura madurae]SFP43072.1 drug resistance transporter, EmrB/QacA subfamily [Actinomadura madurae]SPT58972.1 Antiseptic resistance protein [Actinomadura madurae]